MAMGTRRTRGNNGVQNGKSFRYLDPKISVMVAPPLRPKKIMDPKVVDGSIVSNISTVIGSSIALAVMFVFILVL